MFGDESFSINADDVSELANMMKISCLRLFYKFASEVALYTKEAFPNPSVILYY